MKPRKLTYRSEIRLADGSSKVPDTVLTTNTLGAYPTIAVEIGFTESLDKLYRDAEVLLNGSRGRIELVILLKASETDQHAKSEYPWGESKDTLTNMNHDELVSTIEKYYVKNQLKLLGNISGHVFWCVWGRKTRPKRAIFSFSHPPGQTAEQKNPLKVTIKGQGFRFPVRKVQIATERGIANEKTRRVFKWLNEASLLGKE